MGIGIKPGEYKKDIVKYSKTKAGMQKTKGLLSKIGKFAVKTSIHPISLGITGGLVAYGVASKKFKEKKKAKKESAELRKFFI